MDRHTGTLNILAVVPFAWPAQRGGSEVAIHRLLLWLHLRGHNVRCIVQRQQAEPCEGVLYAPIKAVDEEQWWEWADVVLTHQSGTKGVASMREQYGNKPALQWAHNWMWFNGHRQYLNPDLDIVAWNSTGLAESSDRDAWSGESVVLRPPTFTADYPRCAGDMVTQVNLSRMKGSAVFWELAKRLPDVGFLGVIGGWGSQANSRGRDFPPDRAMSGLNRLKPRNVRIAAGTTNIVDDVYAHTRVLIVPTGWVSERQVGESWGLVAAEALACGIPVVATRSPGMEELLGDAGTLLPHDDVDAWEAEIVRLGDDAEWQAASDAALCRAAELEPTDELVAVERLLVGAA